MNNIILYLIYPIIVSIVTIFVNKKIESLEKLKKKFLLEFCELHSKIFRSRAYNFTDLDINDQNNFIDLIIKNEKYAKGILLELFRDFIMCISTYDNNCNDVNKIFNEITFYVLNKIWHRKNKITKMESWTYNKKIKNRKDENNQIFYIKSIENGNIINTTSKNNN